MKKILYCFFVIISFLVFSCKNNIGEGDINNKPVDPNSTTPINPENPNAGGDDGNGGTGGNQTPKDSQDDEVLGDSCRKIEGRFYRYTSQDQDKEFRRSFTKPYEIWYLFTSTKDNIALPSYNILPVFNNSLIAGDYGIKSAEDFLDFNQDDKRGMKINLPAEVVIKSKLKKARRNDIDTETKSLDFQTKTPSNDTSVEKVGDVRTFYEKSPSSNRPRRELEARCVHKRKVNTKNGYRTLLIYLENNTPVEMPDDTEVKIIADTFLKDGFDNDIYDKLTDLFGCDWMYYNYDYTNDDELIRKDDTITILFCNILEQGNKEQTLSRQNGYVGGFFTNWNYVINDEDKGYSRSNERAIVTLHSPVSCKDRIGDGLTTLAHEFQHLIHCQYYDENLTEYEDFDFVVDSIATNECFSSIAESYISDFIMQQTGQQVDGPFAVLANENTTGYLTSNTNESVFVKGRGPWYLAGMDNVGAFDWARNEDDEDPYKVGKNYGLVASLGNYLLVNYGKEVIKKYVCSNIADLDGIVSAINSIKGNNDMTSEKFLADWGTAVMLSKYTDLPSPYTYNKGGWYTINSLRVPSVNMWLYKDALSECYGIKSSQRTTFIKDTNTAIRVANVSRLDGRNTTFTANIPALPDGLILTVIVIEKQ